MARPSNLKFDANEPFIAGIFGEMFENLVFKLESIVKLGDKAQKIAQLSVDHRCETPMAQSEVASNILRPFYKGGMLNFSVAYCESLKRILSRLASEHGKNSEWKEDLFRGYMSDFNSAYANQYEEQKNRPRSAVKILADGFNDTPPFLDEKATWFLIERDGPEPGKGSQWGFSVAHLQFSQHQKVLSVNLRSRPDGVLRTFEGTATTDANRRYLYIDLMESVSMPLRSNLVLRLAEGQPHLQDLMLGHYTYHSEQEHHLVTKTVALLKFDSKSSTQTMLEIGHYHHNSDQYGSIPEAVRKLLYPRMQNRLSFLRERVKNNGELEAFLKNKKERPESKVLNNYFKTDYLIYYKKNGAIVEDEIVITKDRDDYTFQAVYLHSPNPNRKFIHRWQGQAFYKNSRIISLELSNEKKGKNDDEDPILLSFWIPDHALPYSDAECFPGVIMGLDDENSGPISFTCLLVRKAVEGHEGAKDHRIKAFFKNQLATQNSCEIMKEDRKFLLDDLDPDTRRPADE